MPKKAKTELFLKHLIILINVFETILKLYLMFLYNLVQFKTKKTLVK